MTATRLSTQSSLLVAQCSALSAQCSVPSTPLNNLGLATVIRLEFSKTGNRSRVQTIAAYSAAEQTNDTTELVRRSTQGDAAAFESLYRSHVGRVRALCLRVGGDPDRIDELTQDVFVRAWTKLGTFRGDSAFSTWLHRLAVNVVRERQRSDSRRRSRIEVRADLDDYTARLGMPAEDDIELEKAIATLPPRARRALVLHEIHGYRCREIAEMMGTATGTVQAHLHRARKMLKEMLTR